MVRIVYIENNKFREKWFNSNKDALSYALTNSRLHISECKQYDKREDARPLDQYPK